VTGDQAKARAQRLRARAAELLGEAQALEGYAHELARLGLGAPASVPRGSDMAALAKAKGHSLRSLAAALGVSHAYLSMVGSGKRPASPEVAARLHDLIGWRSPGSR
jgi:hypothetical protein